MLTNWIKTKPMAKATKEATLVFVLSQRGAMRLRRLRDRLCGRDAPGKRAGRAFSASNGRRLGGGGEDRVTAGRRRRVARGHARRRQAPGHRAAASAAGWVRPCPVARRPPGGDVRPPLASPLRRPGGRPRPPLRKRRRRDRLRLAPPPMRRARLATGKSPERVAAPSGPSILHELRPFAGRRVHRGLSPDTRRYRLCATRNVALVGAILFEG